MGREQKRLELHERLCSELGSRNVYFQPPEGFKMQYPCIVYSFEGESRRAANNGKYLSFDRYSITVIDRDPASEIPEKIDALQYCSFDRPFKSDNLYHFVFTIYV